MATRRIARFIERRVPYRRSAVDHRPPRLEVALGLYRRMGFVAEPPPPEMNVLGRTEVIMSKATRET